MEAIDNYVHNVWGFIHFHSLRAFGPSTYLQTTHRLDTVLVVNSFVGQPYKACSEVQSSINRSYLNYTEHHLFSEA